MVVEYKIRFVEGGINVTQSVTSAVPQRPVAPVEQENLGSEFKLATARPPAAPARLTASASPTAAGGEVSPSSTGGGGPNGAAAGGLTIVFGSVHAAGLASTSGSGEPSPASTGGGEVSPSSTGGGNVA